MDKLQRKESRGSLFTRKRAELLSRVRQQSFLRDSTTDAGQSRVHGSAPRASIRDLPPIQSSPLMMSRVDPYSPMSTAAGGSAPGENLLKRRDEDGEHIQLSSSLPSTEGLTPKTSDQTWKRLADEGAPVPSTGISSSFPSLEGMTFYRERRESSNVSLQDRLATRRRNESFSPELPTIAE
mmetsp:Transcript_12698/g.27695  ORF Transcript_12698/g.27695 Transcript_12698/m.27695 type:complete len:181 (-) Transcript_12698:109-651(-)